MHTKHRRVNWRLGFYLHKKHFPFPPPYYSYRDMMSLPVTTARRDIKLFQRGVWPESAREPKPDGWIGPAAEIEKLL